MIKYSLLKLTGFPTKPVFMSVTRTLEASYALTKNGLPSTCIPSTFTSTLWSPKSI